VLNPRVEGATEQAYQAAIRLNVKRKIKLTFSTIARRYTRELAKVRD